MHERFVFYVSDQVRFQFVANGDRVALIEQHLQVRHRSPDSTWLDIETFEGIPLLQKTENQVLSVPQCNTE